MFKKIDNQSLIKSLKILLVLFLNLFYQQITEKIIIFLSKIIRIHLSEFEMLNKYFMIEKDIKNFQVTYNLNNKVYNISNDYNTIVNFLKKNNNYNELTYRNKKINLIDDCKIIINKIIIIEINNIKTEKSIISNVKIQCYSNKLNIDYFMNNI